MPEVSCTDAMWFLRNRALLFQISAFLKFKTVQPSGRSISKFVDYIFRLFSASYFWFLALILMLFFSVYVWKCLLWPSFIVLMIYKLCYLEDDAPIIRICGISKCVVCRQYDVLQLISKFRFLSVDIAHGFVICILLLIQKLFGKDIIILGN